MEIDKINKLINRENERREYQAAESATAIINEIVAEQTKIANCTKRIAELRAELKALEVSTLDQSQILGQ